MKKAPINTEQQAAKEPAMTAWIMGGDPNAILAQAAEGQKSLVESDTLPTQMGRGSSYNAKAILEAAGAKFLGPVEGDALFQYVELPPGWKKVAIDHSMWSKLVDDKGRERASIFYKAAFYDRSAHLSLSCRFNFSFDYERFKREGVGVTNVTDSGKVVYTTEPVQANGQTCYDVSDQCDAIAIEWLNQNHPDWQNPTAYWD